MIRFFRNLGSVYAVNAVNGILGVLVVPVAVRTLGKPGYGLYAVYTVLASYVMLADLGIGRHVTRELAAGKSDEQKRDALSVALGLYVLIGVALVVTLPLLILLAHALFPVGADHERAVSWIAGLTVLEFLLSVPINVRQAQCVAEERFGNYASFIFASGLLRYGLTFGALLLTQDPVIIVAVLVARRVADNALAAALLRAPTGGWRPTFPRQRAFELLRGSTMISLSQLMQLTLIAAPSVLVLHANDVAAFGVFRAAFDIASKVWFISNGLGLLVFPRFVRLTSLERMEEPVRDLLRRSFQVSWLAYLALGLVGVGLSAGIVSLLGLSGSLDPMLFAALFLGVCFNAHANMAYEFLLADGRFLTPGVVVGVSLVVLVASYSVLRPAQELMAIGWAWFSSQLLYVVVVETRVQRLIARSVRSAVGTAALRAGSGVVVGWLAIVMAANYLTGVSAVAAVGVVFVGSAVLIMRRRIDPLAGVPIDA